MELSGSSVKMRCRNGLAESGGRGRKGVKPIKSCSKREGIPSGGKGGQRQACSGVSRKGNGVPGKMQS